MTHCPDCGAAVERGSVCPECGATVAGAGGGANTESAAGQQRTAAQGGAAEGGAVQQRRANARARGEPAQDTARAGATERRFTPGRLVSLGGAGLAAIAAFLPWVHINLIDRVIRGIDGDGKIVLVLVVVAGLIALVRWGRAAKGSVTVLGGLVALIGIVYVLDPLAGTDLSAGQRDVLGPLVEVQVGLYLTAIGGLLIGIGPLVDLVVD